MFKEILDTIRGPLLLMIAIALLGLVLALFGMDMFFVLLVGIPLELMLLWISIVLVYTRNGDKSY